MRSRIKTLICALGAISGLLAGATQAADLKIGAMYPFSGGLALLGDESFRGVELAADERNAAGGINGSKIVLVKADAVDANQAVGEARRLTSVVNVTAIFGSYSSAVSSAATQVTELAGVALTNSVAKKKAHSLRERAFARCCCRYFSTMGLTGAPVPPTTLSGAAV